jgi:hypothetical protein
MHARVQSDLKVLLQRCPCKRLATSRRRASNPSDLVPDILRVVLSPYPTEWRLAAEAGAIASGHQVLHRQFHYPRNRGNVGRKQSVEKIRRYVGRTAAIKARIAKLEIKQ